MRQCILQMNPLRAELSWLSAFGLSVGIHVLLLAVLHWLLPSGEAATSPRREHPVEAAEITIQLEPEPTIFVDAPPSQASEEKPEETPYYSTIDALAGDNSSEDSMEQPAIDGNQDKVLKTADTPPSVAVAATVSAAGEEAPQTQSLRPAAASQPIREEGSTALAIRKEDGEAPPQELMDLLPNFPLVPAAFPPVEPESPLKRERPRTVAQAREQQSALVGEKMRQEGGTKRFTLEPTLDLLKTPFGDYDAAFIRTVDYRWRTLLDRSPTIRNARGKVVLKFQMKADGSIANLEVIEDTAGALQSHACRQAVREPAPYRQWPEDMRRLIGKDRREVQFSFFYN